MTPFVQQFITNNEQKLFWRIKTAVEKLPDLNLGKNGMGEDIVLSCHMLARAVAKVFRLKCIDGHFHPRYEHSWVQTPRGHIIDVYPVAIFGGPLLIDGTNSASPSFVLYHPEDPTDPKTVPYAKRDFTRPWFRRSVRKVVAAMKSQLNGK